MTKQYTDNDLYYEDTLPGGAHWSMLIRKGTTLRLTDQQGGANVGMLFYNPNEKLERYNAPDTLKCQHTFKLTKGHCLYSDMGHIFCSIIDDSVGWHDTVGGNLSDHNMHKKWGERNYQDHRNDWCISGDHAFLVELAKYGLSQRDMAANLNLFSKVATDNEGNLSFVENHSQQGDFIDLRFEMDTLVLLHTCPHPMNTATEYPKNPIQYQLRKSAPIGENDYCMNHCSENQRGFQNNALYHIGCSLSPLSGGLA
ncbi:MAG: urea carboxylase-associated family protein [Methylophaga sp.]|nr:urea carboxylase-associated family protein [Methylophaga sp.]